MPIGGGRKVQSRKGSFVESWANIFVGGSVNYVATLLIIPTLWNPASPKLSSLYLTMFYTVVSLCRSYCLRRWFNNLKWENDDVTPAK